MCYNSRKTNVCSKRFIGQHIRKDIPLTNTDWTKKAAELLKNLNYYKNSIETMQCMVTVTNDEALQDKLREMKTLVSCIELALKMQTDEDLYFLEQFYIRRGERPVDDICYECMMEKSNVYRLRKRAIEKFTMAMYGRL